MLAVRAVSIAYPTPTPAPPTTSRVAGSRRSAPPAPRSISGAFAPAARRPRLEPIVARAFDWDDNVMRMPTEVVLFHKTSGAEQRVDTGRWAVIREQLGQSGEWADWEMRADDRFGTFRNAHDLWDPDVFLRDVELALARPDRDWQGPRWTDFQRALRTAEGARQTTIITARGHEPASIHAALARLRARGLIAHLPPVENIYPVDSPGLRERLQGTPGHPTASKLKVMAELLDALQDQPFALHARRVRRPSGDGRAALHLWHFSDDDAKTYRSAVRELGAQVAAGRWSNVKIVLSYTGQAQPDLRPGTVVLQRDGRPRPLSADESGEL